MLPSAGAGSSPIWGGFFLQEDSPPPYGVQSLRTLRLVRVSILTLVVVGSSPAVGESGCSPSPGRVSPLWCVVQAPSILCILRLRRYYSS